MKTVATQVFEEELEDWPDSGSEAPEDQDEHEPSDESDDDDIMATKE